MGGMSSFEDPQCKVWVGRLATSTSTENLASHMSRAGVIVSCGILSDTGNASRSRGSGFVLFQTPIQASTAIALLDGSLLDGHKIWVDRWTKGWTPGEAAVKGDPIQPRWADPMRQFREDRRVTDIRIKHAARSELDELETLLSCLTPMRTSIYRAMTFCIDNCMKHAAPLARRLINALVEPGLSMEMIAARLFLVSDVLYNVNSGMEGAEKYRSSFQELLPDAFEKLGRSWLRKPGLQQTEQHRVESIVRTLLSTWHEWSVFPPLFTKGLEALFFSPVLESFSPHSERDKVLREKLLRWQAPEGTERLNYEARMRGLASQSLRTSACQIRLYHFELYWHRVEADVLETLERHLENSCVSSSTVMPSRLHDGGDSDVIFIDEDD